MAMTPTQPPLQRIHANGIDFAYFGAGTGPLVLCLHGFPDTAHSFLQLLPALAEAGFRAVAPFMRGYYPSGLSDNDDYSQLTLGQDVLALIDALGEKDAYVIGHDWGSFAAYTAANMDPSRFKKLVLMSVPHMAAPVFSFAQLKKSWYVMFFQLPVWPQWAVARNHFAFIDRLYRAWCPHWPSEAYDLAPVKLALATPGGTTAAIAYYRAMIRSASRQQREVMARRTAVPSLVIVGEADGSVGIDQFVHIQAAFTEGCEFLSLPGVGHFPHREAPEKVIPAIVSYLKT